MSRIGAILSGTELRLLNRLAEANAAVTLHSLRLATQKRVNAPRDDPSAFVALSMLQSRLSVVHATMGNVTAAASMVTQTQSAIDQIQTQLTTIRTELLKDEDRSLTASQRAESQAIIDEAVTQINTLAGSQIDGRRLLDGSVDFVVSGRSPSQVRDLRVHSIPYGSSPTISGSVTQTATQAQLAYTGDGGSPSHPTVDATFTLTGERGSASISVTTADTLAAVAQRINDNSHKTGVTAAAVGNTLTFTAVDYGSDAGISVAVTSGTFNVTGTGTAIDATAVINGRTLTGDGNRFVGSETSFVYEIEFAAGFTGSFSTMTVSGEALTFALATSLSHLSTLAIPGLAAAQLGGLSGTLDQIASRGSYSGLDANTSRALRIVDEAMGEVEVVAGSVDGFYNAAITSSSGLLSDFQDELESAITETDGYDENEEVTLLTKSEALAANAISGLTLLYEQRMGIVRMIQKFAGLL